MQGGVIEGIAEPRRTREGFARTALEHAGLAFETGAFVTAAIPLGAAVVTAHGDGRLRVMEGDGPPREIAAHAGVVLAMAADPSAGRVLTGGQDGRFLAVAPGGGVEEIAAFAPRWVDCVAADGAGRLRACSAGAVVHVWREGGRRDALEHPSTVGGIAIDAKGRRMAVAHYGGVTVWEHDGRRWKLTPLRWSGSHIGVTWSPDGRYVVSVMQENALHGWRLRDRADMRMSGYPSKPRAHVWVGATPHLATGGADQAVCWPFDGRDGPMGRPPVTVADGGRQIVTAIATLPGSEVVLAGFRDGAVLMSEVREGAPAHVLCGSTGSEVTALAVAADLAHLLVGDASGRLRWLPLAKEAR